MALLFAFRDESGAWHGDPEADVDGPPTTSTLTFTPAPGRPGSLSRFAGQCLHVLVASMEGCPGPYAYQLDDGRRHYPTDEVHELLGGYPDPAAGSWQDVAYPRPAGPPAPPQPMYWQLADQGRNYDLSATRDGDQLEIEVLGAGPTGELVAQLAGKIPRSDLPLVARLLFAVVEGQGDAAGSREAALAGRSNHRGAWSAEEDNLLVARAREGATVPEIAALLGRTPTAIEHRLYKHRLGPRPQWEPTAPRQPKPPPAYTMEDLRREHPNSHKPWTPEDDNRLGERADAGATIEQLISEFGRNHGAITSRLGRVRPGWAQTSS